MPYKSLRVKPISIRGTFAMASMGDAFLYRITSPGMGCFSMIENVPGEMFYTGEDLLYDTGENMCRRQFLPDDHLCRNRGIKRKIFSVTILYNFKH